ncbi:hypothetical protein DLAC_03536 [Tieghemostelium lacteum]|uniref:Centromere protein X n=1 Tax=Tieghemostelium lacteum TaxID=361077 RepID=A0A152A1B7_TIELA|nr:hypothetical protein DLAC_03536 [Tieghemostelium lacteum]|eukprot:KYR00038.1 hypothetical protein DLAC_03536 [Tieghemostelium lacteum]
MHFNRQAIRTILKSNIDSNLKLFQDAENQVNILTEIIVREAINRMAREAEIQGSNEMDLSHLESILPKLLLDYNTGMVGNSTS